MTRGDGRVEGGLAQSLAHISNLLNEEGKGALAQDFTVSLILVRCRSIYIYFSNYEGLHI